MSDDEQFAAFWAAHRDPVRRALTLALGDPALASEAVDEAMTRAYARWGRVSALQDPAGWTYRVAWNWATSWLRKRHRRPTRPVEQLDRAVYDSPADIDLFRAVLRLPRAQRAVVVLHYHLDWPLDRIAAVLDLPQGTVKSRLHRAVRSLGDKREVHT